MVLERFVAVYFLFATPKDLRRSADSNARALPFLKNAFLSMIYESTPGSREDKCKPRRRG